MIRKTCTPSPRMLAALMLGSALLFGCSHSPTVKHHQPSEPDKKVDTGPQDRVVVTQPAIPPQVAEPAEMAAHTKPAATAPAIELWSRVFQNYQFPKTYNQRVQHEIDWLLKHPKHLELVQKRAEPFLHYIVEQLEQRDLPGELAFLPAVESAYRPFAYSHGRAAGLWQFIPSTGRMFGLKQTWWYDGRRDITESTTAALDYLEQLHRDNQHDWFLALASYNAGAGTIRKAIRHNQKRGKGTDFWALDLRTETERYVPRLLAIASLLANAEVHGITLHPIPNQAFFARVDIQQQLDLATAAELADMSMDDFYQLNPAFNQWATDPQGPHHLLVHSHKAPLFNERLASLPEAERVQWTRHRVNRGETLSHIAQKHHVTIASIRQANKLKDNRIRAGRYLLIPSSSKALSHYAQNQTARLKSYQSKARRGQQTRYTVQSGDSLWSISRRHKVAVRQLASWNQIAAGDVLRPGQQLLIWKAATRATTASAFKPLQTVHYTIRKGDSLYTISKKFDVTVADLKRWNQINSRYLQPGQRLKVIVDVTRS